MRVPEVRRFAALGLLYGSCMSACASPQLPYAYGDDYPETVIGAGDPIFVNSEGDVVNTLDFGLVAVGAEERSYVWIANVGDYLFRLVNGGVNGSPSFTSDPDLTTYRWALGTGGEYPLRVEVFFRPTEPGLAEGTLWVEDDENPAVPRADLELRGRAVAVSRP
jgi:hypothetical protein